MTVNNRHYEGRPRFTVRAGEMLTSTASRRPAVLIDQVRAARHCERGSTKQCMDNLATKRNMRFFQCPKPK